MAPRAHRTASGGASSDYLPLETAFLPPESEFAVAQSFAHLLVLPISHYLCIIRNLRLRTGRLARAAQRGRPFTQSR